MPRVFTVQLVSVAAASLAAYWCVRRHERVVSRVREYFLTPVPPESLALARIFVFGLVLVEAIDSPAVWYTQIPEEFRRLRMGWEWLERAMPALYAAIPAMRGVLIVTAALSVVGLGTRVVTPVASLFAVYVFAIPTFYFKVNHGLHGQVLVAMIIASAPAGDALSLDSLIRRRRGHPRFGRSIAYTIPMRFAWLVIGTMYLFPGMWKLWESGDLWFDGSALRNILVSQYGALPDFYPLFRAEKSRVLMSALGAATIVFEAGYFFAMFHRAARVVFAVGIAGFHLGVGLTLDIWFDPLFPLLALLDVPAIFEHRRIRPLALRIPWARTLIEQYPSMLDAARYSLPRASGAAPFLVGSVFVLGMFVAGIGTINSFPIGVYPRFAGRGPRFHEPIPETAPINEVFVRQADGAETRLTEDDLLPLYRTSTFLIDIIVDAKRKKNRPRLKRAQALMSRVIRENRAELVREGTRAVMYRSTYLVDPDARKHAQPERDELLDWEL